MKTLIKTTLAASAIFALAGCGGTGTQTPAKTGEVGDGYIEGAYVCHDSNHDWNCLDETHATTAADGSFTLSNYDATQDLIVQIPVGAVDNGPFADGSTAPRTFNSPVWYVYPAGAAPQNGPIFVGPFSTLVYAQISATPGISVDDAVGIVSTATGIDSNNLLGNVIENNTTTAGGVSGQFVAEIVSASLVSVSSTGGSNFGATLNDLGNIVSTANSSNPNTYNTAGYTTTNNTAVSSLSYSGVSDVHADLSSCYFAFEGWNNGMTGNSSDNRYKTLCLHTDANTGDEKLNITQYSLNSSGTWVLSQIRSSAYPVYQSQPSSTLIDMDHVNSATVDYMHLYAIFPAKLVSSNGSSALMDANGMRYKLIVSESDINGVVGSTLPKGPSLTPLIDSITFGSGDTIYKAIAVTQNKTYMVNNHYNHIADTTTIDTHPRQYTVYNEGTMNGAAFTALPNTGNILNMVQSGNAVFVVDYQDSGNYSKIVVDMPYSSSAVGNSCKIYTVSGGTLSHSVRVAFYEIETHNGTKFLVVNNFYGMGGLFIGKISGVDSSNLVYGAVQPPYISHDLTEGGAQHGDFMDDIMINASARDKMLNGNNLPAVP